MERLPGIEPKYKRNGLPYSYHINKDTKEKIASGLKFTIRQKSGNPGSCLPQAPGFSATGPKPRPLPPHSRPGLWYSQTAVPWYRRTGY